MSKRVLIITYYWPPSGGSGVQRWLKFVKYLLPMGWEPIVYTPENPSFTVRDESLLKDIPDAVEVLKLPIWEPYQLFFFWSKLFGREQVKPTDFITTGKRTFIQKLSSWVRGNLFIPDARIFWIKPSVRFLEDFLASNGIDKIITTGPPHSIHLIGLNLKRKNPGIKWVADFRDPWSEWDLLDTLSMTAWARKRHQKLEREVLANANRVITIAPFHCARLEALGQRKIDLITNGFDEDDFPKVAKVKTEKFTIRHIGVVDELRDPRPFLEAVKKVCFENSEIQHNMLIDFVGNVNTNLQAEILRDEHLQKLVTFSGQVPHAELLSRYQATDLQLLVLAHTAIAPGNLPGKFFEYLASGNPILGIGPVHGDAAQILLKTRAGAMIDRAHQSSMIAMILKYFGHWKSGQGNNTESNLEEFTRRGTTRQLAALLDSLD